MKLVSAIMPTRSRQTWAAQALLCFFSQTYEPKELVILDDADLPSFPEGVNLPNVRYHALPEVYRIPVKRNLACRMAQGEILCHFDSDDWSSPDRITDQVYRLKESGKAVTTYHSMLFYSEPDGRVFQYYGDPRHYDGIGTSLCYLKSWWQANPFPEHVTEGEDGHAIKRAKFQDEFISTDGGAMMVARIHANNTSFKNVAGQEYRPVDLSAIPQAFFQ